MGIGSRCSGRPRPSQPGRTPQSVQPPVRPHPAQSALRHSCIVFLLFTRTLDRTVRKFQYENLVYKINYFTFVNKGERKKISSREVGTSETPQKHKTMKTCNHTETQQREIHTREEATAGRATARRRTKTPATDCRTDTRSTSAVHSPSPKTLKKQPIWTKNNSTRSRVSNSSRA